MPNARGRWRWAGGLLAGLLGAALPCRPLAAQLLTDEFTRGFGDDVVLADRVLEPWLGLLNERRYREAWERAGERFRQFVPWDRWDRIFVGTPGTVQPVTARRLFSVRYTPRAGVAPFLPQVLFEIRVDFTGGTQGWEVVVVAKEPDGAWRVIEYQIHPS